MSGQNDPWMKILFYVAFDFCCFFFPFFAFETLLLGGRAGSQIWTTKDGDVWNCSSQTVLCVHIFGSSAHLYCKFAQISHMLLLLPLAVLWKSADLDFILVDHYH